MPRQARHTRTGYPHHVINRGNDRRRVFLQDSDYELFLQLMQVGKRRYEVSVFGLVLMPNHFHVLIQPESELALSAYMRWVVGTYATEFRARTGTVGNGHVFQQRYWSDCICDSLHLLTVLRYVEANPLRARLVRRAEEWRWSSASLRQGDSHELLDPLPLELPERWLEIVAAPQAPAELEKIRPHTRRGRPQTRTPPSAGDAGTVP